MNMHHRNAALEALLADQKVARVDPLTLSPQQLISTFYALQERVQLLDVIGTFLMAQFEAIEKVIQSDVAGGPMTPSQSLILDLCARRWEHATLVIVSDTPGEAAVTVTEPETGASASLRRAV